MFEKCNRYTTRNKTNFKSEQLFNSTYIILQQASGCQPSDFMTQTWDLIHPLGNPDSPMTSTLCWKVCIFWPITHSASYTPLSCLVSCLIVISPVVVFKDVLPLKSRNSCIPSVLHSTALFTPCFQRISCKTPPGIPGLRMTLPFVMT